MRDKTEKTPASTIVREPSAVVTTTPPTRVSPVSGPVPVPSDLRLPQPLATYKFAPRVSPVSEPVTVPSDLRLPQPLATYKFAHQGSPVSEPVPVPSDLSLPQLLWAAANFVTVAGVTSGAIVAVQSPTKTAILNLVKNRPLLPSVSGGRLSVVSALYKGTSASLAGSVTRTGYVTTARGHKPVEEVGEVLAKEERKEASFEALNYTMLAALGDVAVTQGPDTLSQLQKVDKLLPNDFKWYASTNPLRLMTGGFVLRYASSIVNFGSMLILEDKISNGMPIQDPKANRFASGAVSGMVAGFCSYPLAVFRDYLLVETTVNEKGMLVNKSAIKALREITTELIKDPKAQTTLFVKNAAQQLPLRIGLTGAIFSIIAGVGEILGNEPLERVVPEQYQPSSSARTPQGFFSQSKPEQTSVKIEEVVDTPSAKPNA